MDLLDIAIAKKLAEGGGGGSEPTSYNDLSNLPQINGNTLAGDKTASSLGLQDEIDSDNKLSSDLVDDTNATNKFVTEEQKNTWYAKQNAIDSDHKLSSSLVNFSDAEAAALASGIDSSKVGQISTNQTNILYSLNTGVKNLLPVFEGKYVAGTTTFTVSADGNVSVVSVDTSTHGATFGYFNLKAGTYYFTDRQFLNVYGEGEGDVRLKLNGTPVTIASDGKFTLDQDSTVEVVAYTWSPSSGSIYPMICTEEAWNQSHDYQPFALPNADLTQLERQDRNALVEVVDSGAKNRIKLTQPSGNGITFNPSLSVTVNEKTGVVTVSGTTVASDVIYLTDAYSNLDGYVLSGKLEITEDYLLRAYSVVGDVSMADDAGDGNGGVISGNQECRVSLYVYANKSYNFTFKPMVCSMAEWNISHAFAPYALPNSDLTQLEAEDRAELVELVDSGAKNVFQNSDGSDGTNGTWDASTGTFTQTGTDGKANMDLRIKLYNGSTYVESLPTNYNTITANGRYGIEFTKTSAFNNFRCGHNGQSNDCNMWIDASKLKNGTTYVVSINVTNCKQSNGAYTFNDVMICTKAAFGVSKAFVPYRPNYDLVADYVSIPRTKLVYSKAHQNSTTHTYTMKLSDFVYSQFDGTSTCGTYLISVVTWSTNPKHGLWIVSYSGGARSYAVLTNIVGADAANVTVVTNVSDPYIEVTASGKVTISTLN